MLRILKIIKTLDNKKETIQWHLCFDSMWLVASLWPS